MFIFVTIFTVTIASHIKIADLRSFRLPRGQSGDTIAWFPYGISRLRDHGGIRGAIKIVIENIPSNCTTAEHQVEGPIMFM